MAEELKVIKNLQARVPKVNLIKVSLRQSPRTLGIKVNLIKVSLRHQTKALRVKAALIKNLLRQAPKVDLIFKILLRHRQSPRT